ncbi:porin, partial [Escherichia coli]|uniref:porin n=1 Tax=Escherichia coli TaxID=562 RepID=UPI0013654674
RFAVRAKHDLAEDFFAFGRLELRFNGNSTKVEKGEVVPSNTADSFGSLYAHRAYVGLGSKQYGEIAFGRQVTIGDDIAQSGFDNTYGAWDTTLTTSGKSVIRYDYKGIEGLQASVDYRFAEERDSAGEVL